MVRMNFKNFKKILLPFCEAREGVNQKFGNSLVSWMQIKYVWKKKISPHLQTEGNQTEDWSLTLEIYNYLIGIIDIYGT